MRAGVLIIGSLFWDTRKGREDWRRSHLRMADQVHARAPIRYARKSKTRDNTFTMTFVADKTLGQAVLVPCAANIVNIEGLVAEVKALWKAEHLSASDSSIGANWGCVGAMFRRETVPPGLITGWADHFRQKAPCLISPVDGGGLLGIPWPVTISDGKAVDFDIVLATATKPEKKRPATEEIADSWVKQLSGYEHYFFNNVVHGIRTPDDDHIWERVEVQAPCWLRNGAYEQAVKILRAEAEDRARRCPTTPTQHSGLRS